VKGKPLLFEKSAIGKKNVALLNTFLAILDLDKSCNPQREDMGEK
jgi:hypothetical protein